jgi:DNA-binding NarL/FixJ family response regulator
VSDAELRDDHHHVRGLSICAKSAFTSPHAWHQPQCGRMLRSMSLRAVIVDDSSAYLRAARSVLERQGITIVGSAATGAEALRFTEEHDPDVVLVDIWLGEESGFDVAELLTQATGRRTRVVLISAHPEQDLRDLIDASPAIGFVSKSRLSADEIIGLLDSSDPTDGE